MGASVNGHVWLMGGGGKMKSVGMAYQGRSHLCKIWPYHHLLQTIILETALSSLTEPTSVRQCKTHSTMFAHSTF